jgi:hypothetical protein
LIGFAARQLHRGHPPQLAGSLPYIFLDKEIPLGYFGRIIKLQKENSFPKGCFLRRNIYRDQNDFL